MKRISILVVVSIIISLCGCAAKQNSLSTTSIIVSQPESKIADAGGSSIYEEPPSVADDVSRYDNEIYLLSLKSKSVDEYSNEDFKFLLNTKRKDIINVFDVDLDDDCGTMAIESSTIPIYIISINDLNGIVLSYNHPETNRKRTTTDILNEVPNFLFLSHNKVDSLRGVHFNDPIQTIIELLGETEMRDETSLREMPEDWQACSLEYTSDGLTFRYYFEGSTKEKSYYLEEILVMSGDGWNK